LLHRDAVLVVSAVGSTWEGQFDPPLPLSNEQRVYIRFPSGRTAEAIVGGSGAVVHGKGAAPI
jgi:hypothetical protein